VLLLEALCDFRKAADVSALVDAVICKRFKAFHAPLARIIDSLLIIV